MTIPKSETAADAGHIDGGSDLKGLGSKSFENKNTTRLAARQVKFGDLALEVAPYFQIALSAVVFLHAALAYFVGGR